jgi:FKBP-type peptidyl-prolyl cis-trans isomerase
MARKRDRIFALVMAVVFIITTLSVTVGVIWQIRQSDRDANSAANAATDGSSTDTTKTVSEEDKVEGKPMQDFTPVSEVTELKVIDLKEGTGEPVKASDSVTVDYTGAVAATGIVFQSSKDSGQPVSFALNGVIAGWTEGVPGMKVGGIRRLVIPAEKAYGANPPQGSGIPANAPLVFDIELHKIGQ